MSTFDEDSKFLDVDFRLDIYRRILYVFDVILWVYENIL